MVKNTVKKKTSIGVAQFILVIGADRCGGAAVNKVKTIEDASFRSTSRKRMKTTKMKREKQPKREAINTPGATLAKSLVIISQNVQEILTSRQGQTWMQKKQES